MKAHRTSQRAGSSRQGAMLVLIGAMLVIFLAMIVFAIDVSYMQLTRSELRAASDAAAKAGAEALRRTQNATSAVNAAITYGAYNTIGGKPLRLTAADVELGQTVLKPSGNWEFVKGLQPYRAVRVNSSLTAGSASGPVHLFFGGLLGRETFTPQMTAVASQFDQDIVLCLDRSHSMTFDLSGKDWVYPKGIPPYPDGIKYPPHATLSRWAALSSAVENFEKIVVNTNLPPRLGMVTWASEINKSSTEYALTGKTSPAVTRDRELSESLIDKVLKLLLNSLANLTKARSKNVMLGATNMSAGLSEAIKMLEADKTKPLAKKSIILMTDGLWNQGTDPVQLARDAKTKGIVIHTITFLPGAQQPAMVEIATITGGRHYYATSAAELDAAFKDLAYSMPVMLTE